MPIQIWVNCFAWFYIHLSVTSPPAYLHRVHPSRHRSEGGGLHYVIHGKKTIGLPVVLLSDAAKPVERGRKEQIKNNIYTKNRVTGNNKYNSTADLSDLSCPAVSQSCIVTVVEPRVKVFMWKSRPTNKTGPHSHIRLQHREANESLRK